MQTLYFWKDDVLHLHCTIKAHAKTNSIEKIHANRLKIHIKAPAIDGKANNELIKFLAGYFGVNHQSIQIIKGSLARDKQLIIANPRILPEFIQRPLEPTS